MAQRRSLLAVILLALLPTAASLAADTKPATDKDFVAYAQPVIAHEIVRYVGETLAIVAFVTVSFGGFGSVLGALVAGLIIGVVESVSAYEIAPVYNDVVVYVLFVAVLWFRPQGLMGKQ